MNRKLFYSVLVLALAFSIAALAQGDKKRPSPAAVAEGTIDGVKVKINYSAPSARGRKMLGGIEKYGEVWRTGANETTSFEVDKDVTIEGKTLAKGKYALFTIPGESEWVVIINKTIKWGAFTYDQKDDLLRVNVKAGKPASFVETFNISIEKDKVVLKWENTQVEFKVAAAKA